MNAAPYTHLVWKEYRAIRGFWIALIALAVFMQLLVLTFSQDPGWAAEFVYNIALAAPALFAIGCVGTAYAIEKEDGTFDWLRGSPANDTQLFVSKVGLCIAATAAMFAILWLVTSTLLVAPPHQVGVMRGLLGLWPLAAAEALAWGLFFSLLSARPLTAIILALFATSTSVHLLSYAMHSREVDQFQYSRYVAAIPFRLGLLAVVAAADVYLGLRWLGSEERTSLLTPREAEDATARRPATRADIATFLRHPDRAIILGRLCWQTFRQSGRMMLILAALQVLLCALIRYTGLENPRQMVLPVFPVVILAALMGASVFQSDQQRGHFRFFVEHNVPPRYVWVARMLPWVAVASLSTFFSLCIWIGPVVVFRLLAVLLTYINALPNTWMLEGWWGREQTEFLETILPPVALMPLAIFAFAAGQWASMTVRSGLLSGFFSLLLSGFLMAWTVAVFAMSLSWLVYLAPIPFVLLFATWLGAPDWILESSTWKARLKAAGVVLVPAMVLLTAAPFSRMAQVPDAKPGFDPAVYLAGITPAALETGEIYRRANELYDSAGGADNLYATNDASERTTRNQEALAKILEASQRESCALANPATLTNWPVVFEERLLSLPVASAAALERDGKLEEALDRYSTAFVVERQLSSFAPNLALSRNAWSSFETMRALTEWAAAPKQTEQSIRQAIARLKAVDVAILNCDDRLKSNYILCQRFLDGDPSVGSVLFSGKDQGKEIARITFNMRLLPWERVREQRSLNQITSRGLDRLATRREQMRNGGSVGHIPRARWHSQDGLLTGGLSTRMRTWSEEALVEEVSFEAYRRSTLLILACQAYRRTHGELPQSLDELKDFGIPEELFSDPFSGRQFVYFREGIPQPRTESERYAVKNLQRIYDQYRFGEQPIEVGQPGLWSPGFRLETIEERLGPNENDPTAFYYFERSWRDLDLGQFAQRLPDYSAWLRGVMFPIPGEE